MISSFLFCSSGYLQNNLCIMYFILNEFLIGTPFLFHNFFDFINIIIIFYLIRMYSSNTLSLEPNNTYMYIITCSLLRVARS